MTDYILNRPGLIVHLPQTHHEWLALRRGFVGGSDVAAIMGGSPWATPFTIWCEKMGVSAKKDTPAMRYGRENEERLLGWAQDVLGETMYVCKSPYTYVSGDFCANLDGIAKNCDGAEIGIEIKTTSDHKPWDSVPIYYQLQVQHYMMVCGLSSFFLFVEGRGWCDYFVIEQDLEMQARIRAEVETFWRDFVLTKTSPYHPNMDGAIEASYAVAAAEAGLIKMEVNDYELGCCIERFLDFDEEQKKYEKLREGAKNSLMAILGESRERKIDGYVLQKKKIGVERFDQAAFREAHPMLYVQFVRTTFYNKLRVERVND